MWAMSVVPQRCGHRRVADGKPEEAEVRKNIIGDMAMGGKMHTMEFPQDVSRILFLFPPNEV